MIRAAGRLSPIVAMVLAGVACSLSKPTVFVPVLGSAAEQYDYALRYRERNDFAMRDTDDPKRSKEAREAVRQNYKKVIEYYPQDREATPLAKLDLAYMEAKFDLPRVEATRGELKACITMLQELQGQYQEHDYVQAKSLFDEALCWRALGEFEKAQRIFKSIVDLYEGHDDRFVRSLAGMAKYQYQQTYIER